MFKWVVQTQNPYQAHPLEQLLVVFLTPADIAAGWQLHRGTGVNPNTPAAAILPGALPEGVTIGADDIGVDAPDETFGAHAFLNASNVNAGILPAGVDLTTINSDAGKITSDGAGNLTLTGAVNTPRVNFQGTLSASNK